MKKTKRSRNEWQASRSSQSRTKTTGGRKGKRRERTMEPDPDLIEEEEKGNAADGRGDTLRA